MLIIIRSSKKRVGNFRLAHTAQKMKFSIKDFFNKYDQIRRKVRIFCSAMAILWAWKFQATSAHKRKQKI